MFHNRNEAGRMLAARLRKFDHSGNVILALPRGGVPVAYEVAKELSLPMELVLIKKLGHPLNKEYAIGAIGITDSILMDHKDVTEAYIEDETKRVRSGLMDMQRKFMGDKPPLNIQGRDVIVIDDGIATGNTLLATLKILRKRAPAKIIVAVPVASRSAVQKIKPEVDELIALLVPENFIGVGAFYNDFTQISDMEVIQYMQLLKKGPLKEEDSRA